MEEIHHLTQAGDGRQLLQPGGTHRAEDEVGLALEPGRDGARSRVSRV
jgi:hypothetical protein